MRRNKSNNEPVQCPVCGVMCTRITFTDKVLVGEERGKKDPTSRNAHQVSRSIVVASSSGVVAQAVVTRTGSSSTSSSS